jgi:hypothetical protein
VDGRGSGRWCERRDDDGGDVTVATSRRDGDDGDDGDGDDGDGDDGGGDDGGGDDGDDGDGDGDHYQHLVRCGATLESGLG